MSRSQYCFEKNFFAFYIQPGQISVNRFFQMIILAVLSENTVHCPKTQFLCLLYIYTFPIASFTFFVQWTDLGFKNPLPIPDLVEKTEKSTKSKSLIYASLTRLIGQTCKTLNNLEFLFDNFFLILARLCLVQPLKRIYIGYQDFWDKSLGWFLGF